MSLQQANIATVQALVAEYAAGRPEGYLAGVSDETFVGSVLGGLIPNAHAITSKADFVALMEKMPEYMDVQKFEPHSWRAVGDDVLFSVDWIFTWKPTGELVETTALVRKVVKDGKLCAKYHMILPEVIERLTGEKTLPHDMFAVTRVQALLAEFQAGRPEGYMAGVADDVKADMLGGLLPGADSITNKEEFGAVMSKMGDYMTVEKFEPANFVALPNSDMMFNVNWRFVWKATGKTVETTAIVRKVVDKETGCITEKYHMCDVGAVLQDSPRDVIAA